MVSLKEDIMFVRLSHGLPRQSRKVKAEAVVARAALRDAGIPE